MDQLIRKAARFTLFFTSILLLLFLSLDLGLFGEGVKITGFYYIFMGVFFLASLWAYRNNDRFKGF
jgi:ABC-type Na+ efflux pump permease subunit